MIMWWQKASDLAVLAAVVFPDDVETIRRDHRSPLFHLDKLPGGVYNGGQNMDMLEYLREQVRADNYEFSLHAEYEREDEHILVDEIEQSVMSGELLEDYPDDPRGHSCLILGFAEADRAIHSLWGLLPDVESE